QTIQAAARDARSRLLADDLTQVSAHLQQEQADESALLARRATVEKALAEARARMVELERASAEATPALTKANDVYYRLSAIRERLRNLATLAEERLRMIGTHVDAFAPNDLVDLQVQVERAKVAQAALDAEVAAARGALEAAEAARQEAEVVALTSERSLANLLRSAADRREGVARLAGDVAARRSRVEASEDEIGRLQQALAEAEARGHDATREFSALESTVASVEVGEEDLDAAHEKASEAWETAKAALAASRVRLTEAILERDTWAAKAEALELSLARKDGAGALLASGARGVRGTVASLIDVSDQAEDAVAAALGPLADALAVDSVEDAVDAIRWLRDADEGRARFVVGDRSAVATNPDVALPRGAAWASDLVNGPAGIVDTVRAALSGVAVVDDLAAARALVAAHAGVTAVTRRGDVLSVRRASGGSGDAPSILHVQAAFDEACERRDAASSVVETTTFEIRAAEQRESDAHEAHDGALERLHESDAQMAAVAEHLGQLGAASRAAREEADRLRERLEAAQDRIRAEQEELGGLSQRLGAAQAEPEQTEADTLVAQEQRDAHAAAAVLARSGETEARLALRTAEERARALSARAESLQLAAEAERDARARAEESAQKRSRQAGAAREVLAGARFALERIDASVQGADDARTAIESERLERAVQLAEVRRGVDEYGAEYARLTDDAHKDEVARAEQRVRLEQFQQRAIDELGLDPQ
ncbi:MAG TPA: chromosome segregation protein SMC, partial [Thermoanaerobaculia bacterium]